MPHLKYGYHQHAPRPCPSPFATENPGCTPPENLLANVPKDVGQADILLLGCSDARHVFYTLWVLARECATGPDRVLGFYAHPDRPLALRFNLNDREPACLARVLLLLQMFLETREVLVRKARRCHAYLRSGCPRKEALLVPPHACSG